MISPYDPSIAAWLSVTDNSFVGKLAPTSSEFLFRNIFGLQTFTLEPDVPSKGGWHPRWESPVGNSVSLVIMKYSAGLN